MIFSIYQCQNSSTIHKKTIAIPSTQSIQHSQRESLQKVKRSQGKVTWMKKKNTQFDEFNSLIPINISLRSDFNTIQNQKSTLKSRIIQNRHTKQQKLSTKQKRSYSQFVYFDQKRKKNQYSKLFNQTQVDNEHNFIGKSYQRQVINCKVNSKNNRSISVCPEKVFLSKRNQFLFKHSQQNSYQNRYNCKSSNCEQKTVGKFFLRKKMSLNENLLEKKFHQEDQSDNCSLKKQFVSKRLIKQIEEKVKMEIKQQIKSIKKLKMNKYKSKNVHDKLQKNILHIQNSKGNFSHELPQSSYTSPQKKIKFMTRYIDSNIKIEHQFKKDSNQRKPSSSFYCNKNEPNRSFYQSSIHPLLVSEELRPWQIENSDFNEFR